MPKPAAVLSPTSAARTTALDSRIDGGRLHLTSVLGLGAYGVVYLAQETACLDSPRQNALLRSPAFLSRAPSRPGPPKHYAVKCLPKAGLDRRQRAFQRRELALHAASSNHAHVVRLHKVLDMPDAVYAVMDYCAEGDLFAMITKRQRYLGNDDLIRSVFLQIVDAVQSLHSDGIYHRDLKPENILCYDNGTSVCIADFGLATDEVISFDHGCGSYFYMSPECLRNDRQGYSPAHNDIWSLGIILINLACARNPWEQACMKDATFREFARDPDFLSDILPISTECLTLLKRIFALRPTQRLTLSELRHAICVLPSFTLTAEQLLAAQADRFPNPHPSPRVAAPAPASEYRIPSFGTFHRDVQRCNQPQQPNMPVSRLVEALEQLSTGRARPTSLQGQVPGSVHRPSSSDESDESLRTPSQRSSLVATPPLVAFAPSRLHLGRAQVRPPGQLDALDLDKVLPAPIPRRPWLRMNPLRIFSG